MGLMKGMLRVWFRFLPNRALQGNYQGGRGGLSRSGWLAFDAAVEVRNWLEFK